MTELQILPPPPDAIAAMLAIQAVSIAPTILATQQGPDGHLGPEEAGAILVLQATFADPVGAERFWAAAVPLMALLAAAPGFIRRYSFPDGPSITLLALWRTADDARAFARTPTHRAAVHDLYSQRWQYTHFSALWEMTSNHGRLAFCDRCDGITPIGEASCRGCGQPLVDVHRSLPA
ncbi:MAG: antibiotic biosynthesis monooxygenase [Acidimicrobiia bacterium]